MAARAVAFPTSRYVCGLSFYYFRSGPVDIDVLRENIAVDMVYSDDTWNGNVTAGAAEWKSVSFSYNTSLDLNWGAIVFEISESDFGEAVREMTEETLFFGLDGLNLTFCLPCDFDQLSESNNLVLSAPPTINITLGLVTEIALEGESVLCPNSLLVFGIETG